MQGKFLKGFGLAALVAVSPIAVLAQDAPSPSEEPMVPAEPAPPAEPMPPQPGEPMPMPQPGEPLAPPAPEPMLQPQANTDGPVGPMATPPSAGTEAAQSGGTTSSMLTPQPATKEYPLCSKTVQDSCRNPGEGPKRAKKPR
jgi:hypothetical protein